MVDLDRSVLNSSVLLLAVVALSCDDSAGMAGPNGETVATVEFVYQAPTTIDPNVRDQFPDCVAGVGRTHIHPSWRGFGRIDMSAAGAERWDARFTDVPVDEPVRIRISDPNTCAQNPTGASTDNVFANGTRLTRIVDTPGSGTEPGLGFRVDENGVVTP
ncbi:MAG: hypothetical protein GWN99_04585 [Gemmatimonadetes bacterium]|uniref:Lipoprotein n=1 Tax=Candidatus Kutchimonas denitrificans TaxID=3056748 RepID=A0AAE4ZAT3_9BACT|nr:hypothetical protein [Gemmatimonadota bacterium]NIR75727.1 hypothetical protein [Candidatus Kutchimonas denitrificans]NIS00340.1 hypothetical protein [Gemmatimonadota bacterium]NIT65999.1 hypothetical protein [Gemmatimonadota bacterium]NIU53703.1 hypothetical protein [Gemmatimonadota bacterium]